MRVTGTNLVVEGRGTAGFTIEHVLEGGFVVSVRVPPDVEGFNRTNAVQAVKQLLESLVRTGALPDEMPDGENQDGRAATVAASANCPSNRADRS